MGNEDLEIAVLELNDLESVNKESIGKDTLQIAEDIVKGNYTSFLNYKPLKSIIETIKEDGDLDISTLYFDLTDSIEDYLDNNDSNPDANLSILFCGVSSLMAFIQANWTGPSLENSESIFGDIKSSDVIEFLSINGEQVYKKTDAIEYFLIAKSILFDNHDNINFSCSKSWWQARFCMKYQEILTGPSETLRVTSTAAFKKAAYIYQKNPRLELEFGFLYHYHLDTGTAKTHFYKAKEYNNLYTELSGKMGRRTKFQTFDTAQLVLMAKSQSESTSEIKNEENNTNEKKNPLYLDPDEDDIRLENIKFADDDKKDLTDGKLSLLDHCIIIALCLDVKNENPRHGLTWEQMMAYIERILKHPDNWMVFSTALLIKSRLEVYKGKYPDRSALQMQVLIDQFNEDESKKDYPVSIRCKYLFQLLFPPRFMLKKELGNLYLKLGSAKSAMILFEELEMWYKVVQCLQVCKEDDKALKLIDSKIEEEGETPEYLCIKGDIISDKEKKIELYTRCWEISKGKYPRAKRNLGKLAMESGDYKQAIQHYTEALSKNPQYGFAWFRMGCCALYLLDYELAQKCFTRVTFLHPDDGEAWSNLATACIKLGKFKEAYLAYKEGLKYMRDNWKIWENYLLICIKLEKYQESIYCMNNILELGNRIDSEIIDHVIDKVLNNESSSLLIKDQLHQFMENIVTKITNDSNLWSVFAKYYYSLGDFDKAIEYRQKQCRALQVSGWESDKTKFVELLNGLKQLKDLVMKVKKADPIYSTKLLLNSVLKRSAESFENTVEYQELKDMISQIEQEA